MHFEIDAGMETLGSLLESAMTRTDAEGRFAPGDVGPLRALSRELIRSGGHARMEPWELMGPWSELPRQVQEYLRMWGEAEIRGAMAFHPRGRAWPGVVKGLHTLGRYLHRKEKMPGLRREVMKWSPRLWRRPQMTRAAVLATVRKHRWDHGRRPRLEDLLATLGKDPHWIMGGYAEGIQIDPRCRGFYHEPGRNIVWGYLLGIDLVPTPSGVVCHEANLSPGLHERIRKGYWKRDPIPSGIAEFAARRGLRKVVWMGGTQTPTDPWFHTQLWQGVTEAGLELEVQEDPRIPSRDDVPDGLPIPTQTLFPPSDPDPDTLVVRLRGYRVGPEWFLSDKDVFNRVLGRELTRSGEERVKVLPLTPEPGDPSLPHDPGVPNLVYKYPLENQGKGVFFLRARDADHARALARRVDQATGESGGLFQPWVSSEVLPDRLIYEYRAAILVTPVGIHPLGVRRRQTVTPIPDELDEGLIEDRRPFIITGFFGNVPAPVDPSQEALIREASLAVGEGIARVIGRGFVVQPGD
jgi:hypothetical protein